MLDFWASLIQQCKLEITIIILFDVFVPSWYFIIFFTSFIYDVLQTTFFLYKSCSHSQISSDHHQIFFDVSLYTPYNFSRTLPLTFTFFGNFCTVYLYWAVDLICQYFRIYCLHIQVLKTNKQCEELFCTLSWSEFTM